MGWRSHLNSPCLFIDYCKAFDVVNHEILLKELSGLGLNKSIFQWIADFLRGCTQSVVWALLPLHSLSPGVLFMVLESGDAVCHRCTKTQAFIHLQFIKFSHISASIRDELHWLPVRFRPEFKICLFIRNCLVGTAPAYLQLTVEIIFWRTTRTRYK